MIPVRAYSLLVRSRTTLARRPLHALPYSRATLADASVLASLRSPFILDVRDPEEVQPSLVYTSIVWTHFSVSYDDF